jgi:hypothetical protein
VQRCRRTNTATELLPSQNNHLHSRDAGKVPRVQGEQPELTLDRLRLCPRLSEAALTGDERS